MTLLFDYLSHVDFLLLLSNISGRGMYYVNDVDYSDLAVEYMPIAILNALYKIDIKFFNKNAIVKKKIFTKNCIDSVDSEKCNRNN